MGACERKGEEHQEEQLAKELMRKEHLEGQLAEEQMRKEHLEEQMRKEHQKKAPADHLDTEVIRLVN
jgi:hypothetical protein